jgi:hypothetical protein
MKGNALMRRFILAALALLIASTAADARPKLFSSDPREYPMVLDGVTISSFLTADPTNTTTNIWYTATKEGYWKSPADLENAFTTTNGSSTVTVTHTAHGKSVGGRVGFFETTATVGGLNMDGGWIIASVPNANSYTFTHTGTANADAGPSANTTATYSIAGNDGKLRFLCNFSHVNYDDPIIYPQRTGTTHLHLFFGNPTTDGHSTYESLRNASSSTCAGSSLNKTAYWMPAMIDSLNSVVRIPEYFEWYYSNIRRDLTDYTSIACPSTPLSDGRMPACPSKAMKIIERGTRAIYGFNVATGALPATYLGSGATLLNNLWHCQNTSGVRQGGFYRYLHHRTNSALGLTGNGSCPSDGKIVARVDSVISCWNGEKDSTTGVDKHFDHFASPGDDGNGGHGGGNICPSTHPYRFTSFTVVSSWNYTGGISQASDWYLSSDRHNGMDYENGESFHWDMVWAWNDTVLEHFFQDLLGTHPNPRSSTAQGGPYTGSAAQGGNDGTATGTSCDTSPAGNGNCFYVGGPFMRNTSTGGMGSDCSPLGMSGSCILNFRTGGIADTTIAIPDPP